LMITKTLTSQTQYGMTILYLSSVQDESHMTSSPALMSLKKNVR